MFSNQFDHNMFNNNNYKSNHQMFHQFKQTLRQNQPPNTISQNRGLYEGTNLPVKIESERIVVNNPWIRLKIFKL